MNKIIVYVLAISSITSCGIKTKFSEAELKWINVYKVGDSLIFKSDKNKFDTTVIIKKEVYYPSYNPIEAHGTYLPQHAVVWYKNSHLEYHPKGTKMISLIKDRPKNKTSFSIDYLYAGVLIINITNGRLDKLKNGMIYTFNTYHEKAKPTEPKTIYWHEDLGLIKYITHENEVWERINLFKY